MKILGGGLLAIGFFVTVGAIGNDDYGVQYPAEATCTFAQNITHALIGMGIVVIGAIILHFAPKSGNRDSYYR